MIFVNLVSVIIHIHNLFPVTVIMNTLKTHCITTTFLLVEGLETTNAFAVRTLHWQRYPTWLELQVVPLVLFLNDPIHARLEAEEENGTMAMKVV